MNTKITIEDSKNFFNTIILPLQVSWEPKEDITTYELALCLPFFLRGHIMPYEIDLKIPPPFARHFKIVDPNKKKEDRNDTIML
jgi:hypothetical protein